MRIANGGDGIRHETKTIALDGTNNLGELDQPTISIFTVTGRVLVSVLVPYCTEDLASAGGGTLILGVTGNTNCFIASTTATDINNATFWVDATPDTAAVAVPAALKDVAISANVIATVGTADITNGTIVFDVWWLPLSSDGNLVAA